MSITGTSIMLFDARFRVTGSRSASWSVLSYLPWCCLELGSVFLRPIGCFKLILSGFGPLGRPVCQLRSVFSCSMSGVELLEADPYSG